MRIHGDTALRAHFEAIDYPSWEITSQHLRRLWSEAKEELGIEDVVPLELDILDFVPVGGRTPS